MAALFEESRKVTERKVVNRLLANYPICTKTDSYTQIIGEQCLPPCKSDVCALISTSAKLIDISLKWVCGYGILYCDQAFLPEGSSFVDITENSFYTECMAVKKILSICEPTDSVTIVTESSRLFNLVNYKKLSKDDIATQEIAINLLYHIELRPGRVQIVTGKMGKEPARYLADLAEAIRKSREYEDPMVSTPKIHSQQQQILTVHPSSFSALGSSLQQKTQVGITQSPTLVLPNNHSRTTSSKTITFKKSSSLPLSSSSVGKAINFIPRETITPQTSPLLSMAQGNYMMTSISPDDVANIQNIASSTDFFAKKESDTTGSIDLSTSNRMTVPMGKCGNVAKQKGKNKVRLPIIDYGRQRNVLDICERFEALKASKKRKHYHVYEGEDELRMENNNDKKLKTDKKEVVNSKEQLGGIINWIKNIFFKK